MGSPKRKVKLSSTLVLVWSSLTLGFSVQVNMKSKVADRILVVTTTSIIKLDNKHKVMKTIPLDKVSYS